MAPRPSKQASNAPADKTLVIDNGADTIKAGFASEAPNAETDCHAIPNCLAKGAHNRVWVGAQLYECTDFADMTFRRPVQSGCLVNWEAEREIWDQSFFNKNSQLYCDPTETNLLLAEPPNGVATLQSNCDQMVFEEFEFAAYRRSAGPALNAYNDVAGTFGDPPKTEDHISPAECVLVVDSGYSHTVIAPVYKGRLIQQAVRRLDIGGKFLTNYLKEILSLRQLNVLTESYIINHVKETTGFVSTDFKSDMEKARNYSPDGGIVVDYVMPDFINRMTGVVKEHSPLDKKQMATFNSVRREDGTSEAVLALANERFTPPELLFNPMNVGMRQAGIPEAIIKSLSAVPTGLWSTMLANVYLVGGNAKLPGFKDRLFNELRSLAPAECTVRVETAADPVKATWLGGARLASNPAALKDVLVTKQEYQEYGSSWLLRKFAGQT